MGGLLPQDADHRVHHARRRAGHRRHAALQRLVPQGRDPRRARWASASSTRSTSCSSSCRCVTAGMTAFYMFRMWFLTFTGKPRDHHVHEHAHESPWVMTVPLIILAVFSVGVAWGWPLWDADASYLGHVLAQVRAGRGRPSRSTTSGTWPTNTTYSPAAWRWRWRSSAAGLAYWFFGRTQLDPEALYAAGSPRVPVPRQQVVLRRGLRRGARRPTVALAQACGRGRQAADRCPAPAGRGGTAAEAVRPRSRSTAC